MISRDAESTIDGPDVLQSKFRQRRHRSLLDRSERTKQYAIMLFISELSGRCGLVTIADLRFYTPNSFHKTPEIKNVVHTTSIDAMHF